MKKIIDSVLGRSPKGGLYLIPWPTGQGKTYNTAKYIAENFANQKIFYLTTQVKNVRDAYRDSEKFSKGENEQAFKQKAIRLEKNIVYCINWLSKHVDEPRDWAMPPEAKKPFEELCRNYRMYSGISPTIMNSATLEKKLDADERLFRQSLEKAFEREFKKNGYNGKRSSKYALAWFRTKKEYQWLLEMYPQIELSEKNVIFCTVDKFMKPISTIVNPPYNFWEDERIKGSLIFIDEFDAAKKNMKNQLINESIDYQLVDVFEQIRKIHNSFSTIATGNLFSDSKDEKEGKNNRTLYNKMKADFNADDIKRLAMNFQYKGSEDRQTRFFLKSSASTFYSNRKEGKGELCVEEAEQDNNIVDFKEGLKEFRWYVNRASFINDYFIKRAAIMHLNLKRAQEKEGKEPDPSSIIIRSVLKRFSITDAGIVNFYEPQVQNYLYTRRSDGIMDPTSPYFYDAGLALFHLVDSANDPMSTPVNFIKLAMTPERFLYLLCLKAHVFGLSATAEIKSSIGNFDLQYLGRKLDKLFITPNDLEKKRFAELTSRFNKNKRTASVKIIRGKPDPLLEVFKENKDDIEYFETELSRLEAYEAYGEGRNGKKSKDFRILRSKKVILAIAGFLRDEDSKALLVMRNQNLKDGSDWNLDLLTRVIDAIPKNGEETYKDAYEVIALTSQNFDTDKAKIGEAISKGKKAIIVSSYNTIGVGQNLQYEENTEDDGVDKEEIRKMERDIDSIYLEKPTNIVENIKNISRGADRENLRRIINYIIQVEEASRFGDLNPKEKWNAILAALSKVSSDDSFDFPRPNKLHRCKQANDAALIVLVQAVGRLCRTGKDSKKNIYIDAAIAEEIEFEQLHGKTLVPEFSSIMEACEKFKKPEMSLADQRAAQAAINQDEIFRETTDAFLKRCNRYGFDENDMKCWAGYRSGVLRHFSLKEGETAQQFGLEPHFFSEAPEGKKIVNYDFNDKDPSKGKTMRFIFDENESVFTIDGMEDLLKNETLAKHFEKEEIQTSIEEPCIAIISPYAYNDIYKGALGEEVVKVILKEVNLQLAEITDDKKFEKFDFELEGFPNVYVDAKYYGETSLGLENKDKLVKKVIEKLDAIGGKKAICINAMPTVEVIHEPNHPHKRILAIPSLLIYEKGGDRVIINDEAIYAIRRFIYEESD